jgi:DNA helicase-2/ATP-dependent DNA helicase PcrA
VKRTAIFGPPGTGKTTKLLEIIEQELATGIPPTEIAFVSFTNAAVNEAKRRVAKKFSLRIKDMLWFRTVHSLCFALSKLPGQQVVNAYDLRVFAQLHRTIDFSGNPRRKERGDIALEAYNLSRQAQITLKEAWMRCTDWVVHDFSIMEEFVEAYEAWKVVSGRVDFQDMIDNYLANPIVTEVKVSIVDEVQDLNGQQWEVVEKTFCASQRQYIAGDDDQSIYAWSGARVDKMLAYPADEKIILEQSYRCPRKVAAVANIIVDRIKTREDKHWAPRDAAGVFQMYGDYEFIPFSKYKDETWFVLARADHLLDEVRYWLKSIGQIYRDENGYSVNQKIAQKIMTIKKLQQGEKVPAYSIRRAVWDSSLEYNVVDLAHMPAKQPMTAKEACVNLDGIDPINAFSRRIGHVDDVLYYQRVMGVHGDLTITPNVELSTIHKVKGREADNVVILLDQTGRIADSAHLDPDNEHRSWYVAVTRAKKRLYGIMSMSPHGYEL